MKESFLNRQENEFRVMYLSPSELHERLERKAILYLPIGSIEWHNEHLPLGTDTFHSETLAKFLCEEIGGASLPAYSWNTGACHKSDVTYYMKEEKYISTLINVIEGLDSFPAKLLVLINGHGGNYQFEAMKKIADTLNVSASFPMEVLAADPYYLGKKSSCRIDHADTGETSFSLKLIPQLVRMERTLKPDIYSNKLPFRRGPASYEAGDELFREFMSDAVLLIEQRYQAL